LRQQDGFTDATPPAGRVAAATRCAHGTRFGRG
jgi:hypothetical protein